MKNNLQKTIMTIILPMSVLLLPSTNISAFGLNNNIEMKPMPKLKCASGYKIDGKPGLHAGQLPPHKPYYVYSCKQTKKIVRSCYKGETVSDVQNTFTTIQSTTLHGKKAKRNVLKMSYVCAYPVL